MYEVFNRKILCASGTVTDFNKFRYDPKLKSFSIFNEPYYIFAGVTTFNNVIDVKCNMNSVGGKL